MAGHQSDEHDKQKIGSHGSKIDRAKTDEGKNKAKMNAYAAVFTFLN
jgi:hypothetical protein